MRSPVDGARIPTSGAGAYLARRSDGARLHAGVDLRADASTEVLAPEAGRVAVVYESSLYSDPQPWHSRPSGWRGYGPAGVVIEGRSGVWHHLAHLDAPTVAVGDEVDEGEIVARGAGRAHHVHWEVRTVERPRAGVATVDVTVSPGAWLAGELQGRPAGLCPEAPVDDARTPEECRPGADPTSAPRHVARGSGKGGR